jgi:hypothetical protein
MDVSEIRTGIRARGFEADTATQQLAFINQVQRRVAGEHRWPWTIVSTAQATTSGAGDYTYPTGAVHIISLRLVSLGSPTELEWSEPELLLAARAQDNGATGLAQRWAQTGPTTLSLWPTPNAAGTLTVRYHRVPPDLTADADIPILPIAYHDILIAGACELMALRERQFDAVAAFRSEREGRVAEMKRQIGVRQAQTARQVSSSGYYGHDELHADPFLD